MTPIPLMDMPSTPDTTSARPQKRSDSSDQGKFDDMMEAERGETRAEAEPVAVKAPKKDTTSKEADPKQSDKVSDAAAEEPKETEGDTVVVDVTDTTNPLALLDAQRTQLDIKREASPEELLAQTETDVLIGAEEILTPEATEEAVKIVAKPAAEVGAVEVEQAEGVDVEEPQIQGETTVTVTAITAPVVAAQGETLIKEVKPNADRGLRDAALNTTKTENAPVDSGLDQVASAADSAKQFDEAIEAAVGLQTANQGKRYLLEIPTQSEQSTLSTIQQSQPQFAQTLAAAQPTVANAQTQVSFAPAATPILNTQNVNWIDQMVTEISMFQSDGVDQVEMSLTPEHLGKVQIKLEMRDGVASVTIVTETPEAAKLFNDNQSKLSEMMGKAGFELGQHQSETANGQSGSGQDNGRASRINGGPGGASVEAGTTPVAASAARRLIDLVA